MTRVETYRVIFILAGLYNIAFGLWAALAPHAFFRLVDLGEPAHPAIWACLGMVVGLYGLIYLQVACTDPARRSSALSLGGRPFEYDFTKLLIAIGLAGKILGPIGFAMAVRNRELPMRMLPLLALDDFIWWAPFTLYLIDDLPVGAAIRRRAPRICAVVHIAAAAATLLWIRGGSEAVADPIARAAYVAEHVVTWRAGWIAWMIAAVTLVGFYCWWAARCERRRLAAAALVIAFVAIAADFFADALFIGWMPERYAAVARVTTLISETIANGLYTVAGVMLMLASPPLPAMLRALGWAVWLSGFALAVFGAARWDVAIVAASALLLALFIPWVWLAGGRLEPAA